MKYFALGLLVLSGCATTKLSEYNQGCHDGIRAFVEEVLHGGIDDNAMDKGCAGLEELHKSGVGYPKRMDNGHN